MQRPQGWFMMNRVRAGGLLGFKASIYFLRFVALFSLEFYISFEL